MIFKQVTFVSISKKCVTLKPMTYNIDTVIDSSAKRKALALLTKNCKYAERYRLESIVDCELHHHV